MNEFDKDGFAMDGTRMHRPGGEGRGADRRSPADVADFDPALFGLWAQRGSYDVRSADPAADDSWPCDPEHRTTGSMLEFKSAESPPGDELRRLLNEMTIEMRDQFAYFRELRRAAEKAGEADGDETQAKIARADVKAATDAMSLIIRTLEKVDGLQRQLAHDRDLEAERSAGSESHEQAKERFLKLINDRARMLYEQWKRDGAPEDTGGVGSSGAGPPGKPQRAAQGGSG